MKGKTTLYRYSRYQSMPKTVIFAGNGIFKTDITDGWDVLKNLIQRSDNEYTHYLLDKEMFLLCLVEEFRVLTKERINENQPIMHSLRQSTNNWSEISWPPRCIEIRNLIAREYKKTTQLDLPSIPNYIKNKLSDNNTFIITSNWDHVL